MNQEIQQGLLRLFNRALSQAERQAVKELCRTRNERFIDNYLKKCQRMTVDAFRGAITNFYHELDKVEKELE